jgi:hypothetical protein
MNIAPIETFQFSATQTGKQSNRDIREHFRPSVFQQIRRLRDGQNSRRRVRLFHFRCVLRRIGNRITERNRMTKKRHENTPEIVPSMIGKYMETGVFYL